MANFAVLENNTVINIIVAENLESAEQATGLVCIEYAQESPVKIGQTHNGVTFDIPADILVSSIKG